MGGRGEERIWEERGVDEKWFIFVTCYSINFVEIVFDSVFVIR